MSTMRKQRIIGAVGFTAIALTIASAGDALKSGPQRGADITRTFHPFNITGESAGQKHCLI
jgi:hypothetical protein